MNDSSEQLLVDVVSVLYDMFPNLNIDSVKGKFSSILSKYKIQMDETENVQTDLHEKIDLYLSAKTLEGLSPKTLKNYKLDLNKFADKLKKKTNDIISADIRVYLSEFNYLKMSSLGEKLFILKSFFNWLHTEYIIERNPTANLKQPKVEKRMPKYLTIEQLELMRESCKTIRQRLFKNNLIIGMI